MKLLSFAYLLLGAIVVLAAPTPEAPDFPSQIPSYLNSTYVYYPRAGDWFTLGVGNVVQWQWASTEQINLNVVLSHVNTSMLATPIVLASATPAANFQVTLSTPLTGPAAGDGYVVTLYDATSNTTKYATSEPFSIKPVGSAQDAPQPYLVHNNNGALNARQAGIGAIVVAAVFAVIWSALYI